MKRERRLRVSDHSDQECLKLLEALRLGRIGEAEKCLDEIERVYHFANSAPSWEGFFNLTHCFRMLLTRHLLSTEQGHRAIESLVAIGEAKDYNPEMQRVEKE